MSSQSTQQQSQASSAREPDPDAIKMFVGQIPRSWGEAECRELFEQYGSVCQLNVLRDKVTQMSRGNLFPTTVLEGRSQILRCQQLCSPSCIDGEGYIEIITADSSCCFVTYYKRADAIAAQAALHNIRVLPQMYHPVQMKPADIENRNERKLFVGMLNKKLTEEDVRGMFTQFGQIEDCTVLKDPEGKSRGCAFVTFAHRSCAQQAIRQMHLSQTMEGCSKPIVVKFADTQKEKDAKKSGGAPPSAPPLQQNAVNLASTLQQLFQTTHTSNSNPALGAQLAALATLLQTAAQPNVLSLLGNVLSGLGRLTENTTVSNQTAPFPLSSQQTLASLSSSPSLSSADSSAAFQQQQQQQQIVALQQQQRLIEILSQNQFTSTPTSAHGSFGHDSKLNGASGVASNLIQLTGQNASSGIDALHQAYAGLQQFTGVYPQLSTTNLLGTTTTTNTTVSTASGGQSKGPDGCNLFIYHLPQDFTDNDLFTTFSPFGTIISAKVFIDKQTNLSKCFGFVSYDNVVSAQNAISALNGFQIGSKRLKVQLKRGKDAKPYASVSVSNGSTNSKPLSA